MADELPVQESADEGTRPPGPSVPNSLTPHPIAESTTGTPRWVKVFAIIGLALVLLVIVMLLTGHGPGRHMHGGLGDHAGSASFALGRVTPLAEQRA